MILHNVNKDSGRPVVMLGLISGKLSDKVLGTGVVTWAIFTCI